MSTKLYRLEAPDATIGGVAVEFPSGKCKKAQWQAPEPISDTKSLALDCAARVRAALMDEGAQDDIDRTNWVSVVAAIQKHIQDFNAKHPARMRVNLN
jgi:hypothetical protein